uniref:Uncharacterized protein n=1 Tax=Heterorhabditis bacteriophora TaxID=37862 RepID=A0A1I7WDT7_HETBA
MTIFLIHFNKVIVKKIFSKNNFRCHRNFYSEILAKMQFSCLKWQKVLEIFILSNAELDDKFDFKKLICKSELPNFLDKKYERLLKFGGKLEIDNKTNVNQTADFIICVLVLLREYYRYSRT